MTIDTIVTEPATIRLFSDVGQKVLFLDQLTVVVHRHVVGPERRRAIDVARDLERNRHHPVDREKDNEQYDEA